MYKDYETFWLYYVSEHLKPATRIWHAIGTSCVLLLLLFMIWQRNWWLLLLLPVLGYGPAWFSHFRIERNRPATFQYPLWSLRSDFRMYGLMLTGRMGPEIERAKRWLQQQENSTHVVK
ncbi:MAG: Mpo1-like protein [Tumebacillaceae bacterium]